MIYEFNVTTNTNGIYCVVKTMLKLMFIEMASVMKEVKALYHMGYRYQKYYYVKV